MRFRSTRRRRWGIGLLAGVLLAPSLGRGAPAPTGEEEPKKRRIILRTEYDDQAAGKESAAEVEAELGLVRDPEITALVEAVGQRLVSQVSGFQFDYTFRIVDQDAPNAFALPGGYVYVSRGLLVLSDSEDELASVLAHEMAHVVRRHAAARQEIERHGPPLFNRLQITRLASYSRDQEREADRLGQEIAARAGYDPAGIASFLKSLEFTVRLELGHSRLPTFFDTHPSPVERAASAAERAAHTSWTRELGVEHGRVEYLRRLEGLVVGTSATEGIFRDRRFLHPDLDFSILFPNGWEMVNTRRAVGAIAPDRQAQVYLEVEGKSADPAAAARAFLDKARGTGFQPEHGEPVKLGAIPAYRVVGGVSSPQGRVSAVLTWLRHGESIYRLTGAALGGAWQRYEGVFLSTARTFRPLTPEQRASIRETHLRIVEARSGESLNELNQRTGNAWDLQRTAVMNDLFASQTPEPGQPLKVAIREPY